MSLRKKLIRLAYEKPELRSDLIPLIKVAARVGDSTWRSMLKDLERGKPGNWSFDGRGLRELENWIVEQGGKAISPSSRFSEGDQINYTLNGISLEGTSGNFMGPFTQVQAQRGMWRGTPYLGD